MSPWLAPLVVAACAVAWLAVQRAWMRSFPGAAPDPDALSGRLGCHGCGECEEARPDGAGGSCRNRSERSTHDSPTVLRSREPGSPPSGRAVPKEGSRWKC